MKFILLLYLPPITQLFIKTTNHKTYYRFIAVDKAMVEDHQNELTERYSKSRQITGIRGLHFFRVQNGQLEGYVLSQQSDRQEADCIVNYEEGKVKDVVSSRVRNLANLNQDQEFKTGDWVCVAFTDTWYPGIVTEVNSNDVQISFMEWCKFALNKLTWPSDRTDIRRIEKDSIMTICNPPVMCSSSSFRGKQYEFSGDEFERITKLF